MTYTLSKIKQSGVHPKKRLGQNFLADPSTGKMIVKRADISSLDVVVEIGAGLGALTLPIGAAAKKVYAIEKDHDLISLLKEEIASNKMDNIIVLEKNILETDLKKIAETEGQSLIVMGNLPYNISSQVVVRLISYRNYVKRACFMFQKELATRLIAQPGSKDYGRLSVMLGYCGTIKPIADVRANLFYPRPKVDSIVVEIKFLEEPEYKALDENFLFRVIKAGFGKRRKTLKNAISGSELEIDRDTTALVLGSVGIESSRRAETLSVSEFVNLANELTKRRIK